MKWRAKLDFDLQQYSFGDWLLGVDEVGWGSFAGHIVLGCVGIHRAFYEKLPTLISQNPFLAMVDDSKKIGERNRPKVADAIKSLAGEHFVYGIGEAHPDIINSEGMVPAYKVAYESVIGKVLEQKPEIKDDMYRILLDGSRKVQNTIFDHDTIIKGDAQSYLLGCASTVAKVYRDNQITELAKLYPQYGWDRNKGYGTEDHREAISKHGSCPMHRLLFIK